MSPSKPATGSLAVENKWCVHIPGKHQGVDLGGAAEADTSKRRDKRECAATAPDHGGSQYDKLGRAIR